MIEKAEAEQKIKKVAEIRKMKKFGKKVQQDVLKKREMAKNESKMNLKRLSKKCKNFFMS